MEQKGFTSRLNWKTVIITTVITAIATLLVTVAAPIVIDIIKTPELRIEYSVQDTIPFKTQTEEMATYQITLKNTGTKILEDIFCKITFTDADISQSTFFSEMPLEHNLSRINGTITAEIVNLNPQEVGVIYVLATSSAQLPAQPDIQLRAKGVSGIQSNPNEEANSWEFLVIGLTATATAMTVISTSFKILNGRNEEAKDEDIIESRSTQKDTLGYLCGVNGLTSEMERYYSATFPIYYRREADRFGVLATKNLGEARQRMKILNDLLEYVNSMKDESKAIVHFNIAKIAKILNEVEEEKTHLEKAKKINSKLVELRLKFDPVFKK